jgi:hypothetical protein
MEYFTICRVWSSFFCFSPFLPIHVKKSPRERNPSIQSRILSWPSLTLVHKVGIYPPSASSPPSATTFYPQLRLTGPCLCSHSSHPASSCQTHNQPWPTTILRPWHPHQLGPSLVLDLTLWEAQKWKAHTPQFWG